MEGRRVCLVGDIHGPVDRPATVTIDGVAFAQRSRPLRVETNYMLVCFFRCGLFSLLQQQEIRRKNNGRVRPTAPFVAEHGTPLSANFVACVVEESGNVLEEP